MPRDVEKLQGHWGIVSLEMDGQQVPVVGAGISIHGDRFTTTGMGAPYEGTITLDATARPRTIDMKFLTGPEKGNTSLGIYELKSGTWRLCLTTRGSTRPNRFAAPPGTGFALEVLRREPAAPALALDNVRFEPVPEIAGEWAMVSGTLDGVPLDNSMIRAGRRIVQGSEMIVKFGKQVYAKARFTVDRTKTPWAIDYYNVEGGMKGRMQRGTWQLSGNTLTLCLAAPDDERPNAFVSNRGDRRTFTVWKKSS
jgi:uncharacterized protein (TIGR03067 family)